MSHLFAASRSVRVQSALARSAAVSAGSGGRLRLGSSPLLRLRQQQQQRLFATTTDKKGGEENKQTTSKQSKEKQAKQTVGGEATSAAVSSTSSPSASAPSSPGDTFLSDMSALINANRTSTKKGLWQMRAQEREDMDSHLSLRRTSRPSSPLTPIEARANKQDPSKTGGEGESSTATSSTAPASTAPTSRKPSNPFPPIQPLDSFWSVSLPFDSGIRFERILEVVHRASSQEPLHRFPLDQLMAMQGCVTWVGSSSMEIWIEMRVEPDPARWASMSLEEKMAEAGKENDDLILSAYFTMVARNTLTQKSTFVPPLDVANLNRADLGRFRRGEASAARRKREAATSLERIPPTADEIKLIHDLLMDESKNNAGSAAPPPTPTDQALPPAAFNAANLEIAPAPEFLHPGAVIIRPKTVVMSETEMASVSMTQPQDRNTNGKIFGGRLMAGAYELARASAFMFCGANSCPWFIAVDNMTFLRPVEIGSLISFRSKICYSAGHPDTCFQIRVETLVHDLLNGRVFPSNIFHFTFQCARVPVRKVVPRLYSEAVDYLDGKRRREKLAVKLREEAERRQRRMKAKQEEEEESHPIKSASVEVEEVALPQNQKTTAEGREESLHLARLLLVFLLELVFAHSRLALIHTIHPSGGFHLKLWSSACEHHPRCHRLSAWQASALASACLLLLVSHQQSGSSSDS